MRHSEEREPKRQARFAIESPNACPEKDRFGKSESIARYALPALRIPDSTGRTAPSHYHANPVPKVPSSFHRQRVGLNPETGVHGADASHGNCANEEYAPTTNNTMLARRLCLSRNMSFQSIFLDANLLWAGSGLSEARSQ